MFTFTIDWISATLPKGDAKDFAIKGFLGRVVPSTKNKGMYGYTNTIHYETGAKRMYSTERLDMGEHFVFSGSCLANIWSSSGINPFSLLYTILDFNGRVSRIDFAIDVRFIELSVTKLSSLSNTAKKGAGRAPSRSLVTSDNGGATHYVGSRSSDKFLRIYNKSAQLGEDGFWTRIELEMKGQTAHAVGWQASYLNEADFFAMCSGMIKSVFDCDDETWKAALEGAGTKLDVPKPDKRDTMGWLLKSVAPAIARMLLENPSKDVWGDFVKEVERIMKQNNPE